MTDNQRLKKIRAKVKLNQPQFASALNMKQGSISDIERGRTGVSSKLKKELEKVFYIASSYWENDEGAMFQSGKEQAALDKARAMREQHDPDSSVKEVPDPSTKKMEELAVQLAHKEELLAAKDETISILKDQVTDLKTQLEDFKKQYTKLEEERIEMKLELNALQKKIQRTGGRRRSG